MSTYCKRLRADKYNVSGRWRGEIRHNGGNTEIIWQSCRGDGTWVGNVIKDNGNELLVLAVTVWHGHPITCPHRWTRLPNKTWRVEYSYSYFEDGEMYTDTDYEIWPSTDLDDGADASEAA